VQIGVITNPNSKKNKDRHLRREVLQQIVGPSGMVRRTDTLSELKPVLREFLRRDLKYWVSDGGDGTLHHLVNCGIEVLQEDEFRHRRGRLPVAVPTNGGTIDFVAINAGIRGKGEGILSELKDSLERGEPPDEVEVESLVMEAEEETPTGIKHIRRVGFAMAAGGIGQRFFALYYADPFPTPMTIMRILAKGLASSAVALTPLRRIPGMPPALYGYADHLFKPTQARITVDGKTLPWNRWTGVHISSLEINLGNVLRFFPLARQPGKLHVMAGEPTPLEIIRNIPRMHLGLAMQARRLHDKAGETVEMEATSDELLCPVVDGEIYQNIKRMTVSIGPLIRVPYVRAEEIPVRSAHTERWSEWTDKRRRSP
jgi:diacylglycerol kinase family enzyme